MEAIENTAIIAKYQSGVDKHGVFMPGDVLKDFDADFLVEAVCRYWILKRLHPYQPICPGCGSDIQDSLLRSFWDYKRIRCDRCEKYFTALTGTFLSGCHFDFREIFLLSVLIALNVADQQIAAILNISSENVRLWRHRFAALARVKKLSSGE